MVCISYFIFFWVYYSFFRLSILASLESERLYHRSTYTKLKNVNAALHLKSKKHSQQTNKQITITKYMKEIKSKEKKRKIRLHFFWKFI